MTSDDKTSLQALQTLSFGKSSLAIPLHTARLLYIWKNNVSNKAIAPVSQLATDKSEWTSYADDSLQSEPSMIFLDLPIKKLKNEVPLPDYYPRYADLTSGQRWVYVNWLRDITSPVYIGYVFLYYYGLERHLIAGDFEAAVDEILLLRNHHRHRSFSSYSDSALIYSCLFRRRPDKLRQLLADSQILGVDKSTALLIAHHLGDDLNTENLMYVATKMYRVKRRYIELHPEVYRDVLLNLLKDKYGQDSLPLADRYRLGDLPPFPNLAFANISFPEELRWPLMPDFFQSEPFVKELEEIFRTVHERVKQKLKMQRRGPKAQPVNDSVF